MVPKAQWWEHLAVEQAAAASSWEGSRRASATKAAHALAVAAMPLVVASWSLVRGSARHAPSPAMAAAATSLVDVAIWRVSVAAKVASKSGRPTSNPDE